VSSPYRLGPQRASALSGSEQAPLGRARFFSVSAAGVKRRASREAASGGIVGPLTSLRCRSVPMCRWVFFRPKCSALWSRLRRLLRCGDRFRHSIQGLGRDGALAGRALPELDRRQGAESLDRMKPGPFVAANLSWSRCFSSLRGPFLARLGRVDSRVPQNSLCLTANRVPKLEQFSGEFVIHCAAMGYRFGMSPRSRARRA